MLALAQARKSMGQVHPHPAAIAGGIRFANLGARLGQQHKVAGNGLAAEIQAQARVDAAFDGVPRIVLVDGRLEICAGNQFVHHPKPNLGAEDKALQHRQQLDRREIRQHSKVLVLAKPEQGEQCDDPALGSEPAIPLPASHFQGAHIIHGLRLQEASRFGAAESQQREAGQSRHGRGLPICLERHGVGT